MRGFLKKIEGEWSVGTVMYADVWTDYISIHPDYLAKHPIDESLDGQVIDFDYTPYQSRNAAGLLYYSEAATPKNLTQSKKDRHTLA